MDKRAAKDAIHALKARVSGSNIRNQVGKSADPRLNFNTSSATVHKSFGIVEKPNASIQSEQKKKLSQSNFSMGKSPSFYHTSQKSQFPEMRTDVTSLADRRKAASMNRATNFIAMDGFEAPPKQTFETGAMPMKEQADLAQVGAMIDNLRKEHFTLGY